MAVDQAWRKSRRSENGSACVEVHRNLDAARDSKNLTGRALPVTGFRVFVEAVKSGRFDR